MSLRHSISFFAAVPPYRSHAMKTRKEGELVVLSVRELLALALRTLGGYPLVLRFKPTDDEMADCSYISGSLPWLHATGEQGLGTVCENLREHRLAVVICSTEDARSRLKILGRKIRKEHGFPGQGEKANG